MTFIAFIVFAFFFGCDVMAFVGLAFIGFTFSVLLKAFWRRAERLMDAICLAFFACWGPNAMPFVGIALGSGNGVQERG